ncbi:MAG: phosphoglycerate kinase [Pseudomonadota bacterium]
MLENIVFMQGVKTVKDIDLQDKRVLIRVDFNVPMDDNLNITDDTRIRAAIPTIHYCIDNGAKSVVLMSHFGQPKEIDNKFSLKNLLKRVERLLDKPVQLFTNLEEASCEQLQNLPVGTIAMIENTRFFTGETKNDEELSKKFASLCDVYVNDAFGASHRKHSSTYGTAKNSKVAVAGLLMKKEIDSFAKALTNPAKPMLLIVGGAKVSSKITLLKNILGVVDKIVIGGAMSFTFLKALGYNMQKSLVEDEYLSEALEILKAAKEQSVNIYLPVDVATTNDIKNPELIKITTTQDIPTNFIAADIGPASIKLFEEVIRLSQTIIWNGPMGIYEMDRFSRGTFAISHYVAENYSYSIIGGGDTADAVERAGDKDNMSFISTGGGASLELLEGKILPGFEALNRI